MMKDHLQREGGEKEKGGGGGGGGGRYLET